MNCTELLLLGVGLSMDAFAVSVCKGLATRRPSLKNMAACGLWFGGFQALMPLIGFYLGSLFAEAIEAVDHWVAFVLLALIGLNMVREAVSGETEQADADFSVRTMLTMAIAGGALASPLAAALGARGAETLAVAATFVLLAFSIGTLFASRRRA